LVSKQDLMARVWANVFPLSVNDHERPSPDGATQGSSV
jgi:hypothetical protein